MHLSRRSVRYIAAALSAAIAAIYYLIGLGALRVLEPGAADDGLLVFGAMAGSGFLFGTLLLLAFDRRPLWMLGALLQLFVVWGYISVAPTRTPPFEVWGITLRIIQVPLFAALVYLALRNPVRVPDRG